jgi:hypothetical protein
MTSTKDDRAAILRKAVERYRREKKRAAEIERRASDEFSATIREVWALGAGMKKSEIIRGIGNEWSRTWVDRACRVDEATEPDKIT